MVATKPAYSVIGTRPVRPDGTDKVTGRAEYGADVRLPGMLHGRVLRSPHAHARIEGVDTAKAQALPGVQAVVTNADFPAAPDKIADLGRRAVYLKREMDNIMASDKVLYHGHAVAAVCATDPHIAEDALALIEVAYAPLPPVLNVRDAMLGSAPLLHEDLFTSELGGERAKSASNVAQHIQFQKGDLAAGFAEASVVIEREFETTMVHQGYIEPHTGAAFWNRDGDLTVWTSTQGAFVVRDALARLLRMPVSKIKVVPMEIGGGFGGKIPIYLEPVAALLSQRAGKPVKMTMERDAVLKATGPTSGTYIRIKIGAQQDGTLTAAEAYLAYEAGAYPGSPVGTGATTVFGPYDIPNQSIDGYDVVVNKPKTTAYRAPGAPASEFAAECVINELADRLGIDPLEIRRKNSAQEGTRRADGFGYGPIGHAECVEAARGSPHYRSELSGENRGRGVASGGWGNIGLESSAYAQVNSDGTVGLVLGSIDIGGTRASLAMQLAETLGIPYEQIKPLVVDTDSVGFTHVTGGSRTTFAGGWAVYEAGQDLRRQLAGRAAAIWDVDTAAVTYGDDGVVHGPADADGKERSFAFKELARQLARTGGTIVGRANVNKATFAPAFGTHIVDVEVDPKTGKVEILRYTAVQDAGTAIHPAYVEGQMQGGVAQGVGMALTEEYYYDAEGHLVNSSLLDYRMPTALDLPLIETEIVEVPNPGHPFGVRGVGEVPIIPPAPAIAAAIYDAIGVRFTKLPISPRAIVERLLPDGD